MNLATGVLVFAGMLSIVLGIISKLLGVSLLSPYVESGSGYFIVAVTCLVVSLVVDRFQVK